MTSVAQRKCDPLLCGPTCVHCEEERLRHKLHVAVHGQDLLGTLLDAERRAKEERYRADSLEARLRATMGQLDHLDKMRAEQGRALQRAQQELADARAYMTAVQMMCSTCGERARDVVLGCGHLVLCGRCVDVLRAKRCAKCPQCGENFGRPHRLVWT